MYGPLSLRSTFVAFFLILYLYILCVCYDMGLADRNKTYDDLRSIF